MVAQRGSGSAVLVVAGILGFVPSSHAACNGPAALVAKANAHPTSDTAMVLGSWYATHKQFDCAIATFRAGLKADPESAQLHYLVGLADVGANNPGDALPELERAIQLEPGIIETHLLLADLEDHAGKHHEAEEQWRQALKIDPKSATALEGLSADLLAREDFSGAVLLLTDAPRTQKLSIRLAQALGRLNLNSQAHEVLQQALNASPNSVPLAIAMTNVLMGLGRFQDAINLLQHAVDTNPRNQEAQVELFRVLVLTNRVYQARPMGLKLLESRPKDPGVLYLNGIVFRTVGDYPKAKTVLEQAVAINPNYFNSRYNLGMVLVFLKEWQPAKEQLEKAIELGAPQPQVHYELARALRALGENDRAQQELQIFQKMKGDKEAMMEASNASIQGDKLLADGKLQEAIATYRSSVDSAPDNAEFKYKLSVALHQLGDSEGEREQLEAAVKLDPSLAAAQRELGYLLSRSGDTAGAINHFKLAVEAAPEWVEAWVNLAAQLAIDGQYTDARTAIDHALRLDPGNEQAQKLHDRLAKDPAAQQAHP